MGGGEAPHGLEPVGVHLWVGRGGFGVEFRGVGAVGGAGERDLPFGTWMRCSTIVGI
jgi:hypothetical protein